MTKLPAILKISVALVALTACSPLDPPAQFDRTPASVDVPEAVVDHQPTVVDPPFASGETTVTCAPDNGACSPIPESDPSLPPFNCENGADNGTCDPAPVSDPDLPVPGCDNCVEP